MEPPYLERNPGTPLDLAWVRDVRGQHQRGRAPGRVQRLCAKARRPIRSDLLEALGVAHLDLRVASVCVYHQLIAPAKKALAGSGIPVCAVSG